MGIAISDTRDSTGDQDVASQICDFRQWASSHNHAVVSEYQDAASGARRREQLDDPLTAARRREFDLVCVEPG